MSALPEPEIGKIQALALLITGKVRVIRQGGGFGESETGATHNFVSFKTG